MESQYYAKKTEEVLKELVSSETGLSLEEAKRRLTQHGPNELKKDKKFSVLGLFFSQFKNALLILLIFAGLLSLFLGEYIESAAIFGILFLNTILGFFQEYRAEKAMEALEKLSTPYAKVMRDGKEQKIPAKDLVPGDVVLIEAGDIIPADARLLDISSLQVDEAALTGESVPSKKFTEPVKPGTHVADQENMIFTGTSATYGKGTCIVTATGMKTEFGKIAHSLQKTKETKTPLQVKFEQLAKQIGFIAVALILAVLISGTLQGTPFAEMILLALALTVSTVPNSLPIIVTVSLSMGAKRLVKKNMLIKKLPAAEALGAATIICSDKTGTITKNQMTIKKIFVNNDIIDVSGTGYDPEGKFFIKDDQLDPKKIELLLRIGYLCNNSKLKEKEGHYSILGDPTEGALKVLGVKGDLDLETLQNKFNLIEELPFDSERKRMSKIFENKLNGNTEVYVKGAPDLLVRKCSQIMENGKIRRLTQEDRMNIIDMNERFANDALRVLGLAYNQINTEKKYGIHGVEKDLIFVGLVGMIDPPRDEVKEAIKKTEEAGIRVMIITGDHALTTKAIAKDIGLFKEGDLVLEGSKMDSMSDDELERKIENIRIVARALPIQKLRIVEILQKKGHVVAMTGDGVNDSPALKKADIGIAMGITGTDVSKEVAKAILIDDNFATIVNAIEEGRNIYNKMIKSAKYLLSCNAGEIFSVFLAIMLQFPLPLLPLMILLMNLLTDDFPALGLGFESSEEGIMQQAPRDPKEKPITKSILWSILIFGIIMGLGTLFMFMQYKDTDLSKAQTIAFTTLVLFQMFAVMSSRSMRTSMKKLNPFTNMYLFGAICLSILIQVAVIYMPPLQNIFGTVAISSLDWIKIIGVSSLGFIVMEASKLVINRNHRRPA